MDCRDCQQLFSEHLDGILEPDLARRLEAHLQACPPCADEYRLLVGAVSLLRSMPRAACPPGILAAVRQRLAEEEERGLRGIFRRWRALRFTLSQPAAAATIAVAVVAMLAVKTAITPPAVEQNPAPAPRISESQSPSVPPSHQFGPAIPSLGGGLLPYTTNVDFSAPGRNGNDPAPFFNDGPDVAVTVASPSRQRRFQLCRRLLANRHWRATIADPTTLVIQLDPSELPHLHRILADETFSVQPPAALDPAFGPPKRLLTVAVRLR